MCSVPNKQLSLSALKYLEENFQARYCKSCGAKFWTRDAQDTCGDAPCAPYSFINAPVLNRHDLNSMREAYLAFFERHGHTRISPYPVIARWREDVLLVNASIYDFQPLITSGKVPPPANPLTISQPCIRLTDIDVVGKSGRHLTNFEMMAHHAFNYPGCPVYWSDETIMYCDTLLQELGAAPDAISYKESPWAGGGNAGIALEVLVGGLELATLVFMDMQRSSSGILIKGDYYDRMDNCIVDTGYGLERMVWAALGSPTIYDAVMPRVVNYLMEVAGIEHSLEDPQYASVLAHNARLAGSLNVHASNLHTLRKRVADATGVSVEELTAIIEPVETVYAIADHARCLMYMLGDGIVPSNVKAGYLARLVIRKVLRSINTLQSGLSLEDVVRKHIADQSVFPLYKAREDTIVDIIQHEERKYATTIDKGRRLVKSVAQRYKGQTLPLAELITLYDSHGMPPELVAATAKDISSQVDVPNDFYSLVAETHERVEVPRDEEHEVVIEHASTYKLFYDEPERTVFEAQIIGITGNGVILDRTLFYPGGGGQPEDVGQITTSSGIRVQVTKARAVDHVIIHEVKDIKPFAIGEMITGTVDVRRRMSLARHHTATHVLLSSIRQVLGGHVWQEGAQKGVRSSRLDISHYKKVTDEEQKQIERLANEIIMSDIPVDTKWMNRNEAEQTYGFALYQGGVPPGSVIRVVRVGDDVQACAGTHMTSTGKVGPLRIIRTERVQDGVERFEFAAGIAAIVYDQQRDSIISDSSRILRVPEERLPATVNRFFNEWKDRGKQNDDLKELNAKLLSLLPKRNSVKDALRALNTKDLGKLKRALAHLDTAFEALASSLPASITTPSVKEVNIGGEAVWISTWRIDVDMKELIGAAQELLQEDALVIVGGVSADGANIVVMVGKDVLKRDINAVQIVQHACAILGGGGGGKADRAQGGGPLLEKTDEAIAAASELALSKLGELNEQG
ncbi:MAG: alanine--tRNA ligase [Halobacteriota archaeon]